MMNQKLKKQLMKALSIFIIFLSTAFYSSAQNIVLNGDFESMVGCPTAPNQMDSAQNWFKPTQGSPDYRNACSSSTTVSVPNSISGHQNANSGNGYAGIFIIQNNSPLVFREYIEEQLLEPLQANACYHFKMYVNSADNMQYTSDAIGAYLSDTIVSGIPNSSNLLFNPQFENSSGNFIDTLNWNVVSGNYIAHGGEDYLIIGNFKTDSTTQIVLNNNIGTANLVYFYIDDVSLTLNDITEINLGVDTSICKGEQLFLNATSAFQNYLWQDSSGAQTFLFADTSLGNYNLYVTATDSNGCKASDSIHVTVELCDGISSITNDPQFFISPNPTSGEIALSEKCVFELFDVTGRKLFYKNCDNNNAKIILPPSLANGIYFYRAELSSGYLKTGKLVLKK